ncbi:MAG: MBL fold metallo-hydrolase, partial [Bacteroidales bacterium]|nr:MBL fold metallo-hydrolase [Bacteroidales bacterium]
APSFSTMRKFFSNKENKVPNQPLKTKSFDQLQFSETGNQSISFAWFGHSSVLLRISDKTILIDPVFGERASLFSLMGPKRFPYTNVHKVEDLPPVDLVLISHDHYDHLEYETIRALKDRVKRFYVPLGVRVHLERWGVNPEKIVELDWWNEVAYDDRIGFAFTPTRHFSGRGLTNRNQTLWGSWSILTNNGNVFFSGDSGYFDVFEKVGEKYGPFDLAFVENGQYNVDWASIHMMPEESALVASQLRARFVVPIHWGKFSLSIHSWTEPIERFLTASKEYNYTVLTPAPGEIISLSEAKTEAWWKD